MKLRASASLLSAIGLCRRFIAAANHGKIEEPENLARSHCIRLADARSRPQRSPGGDWTADCLIPEYNLRSSGVYPPGRKAKGHSEVLKGFGRQRLRVGTTALP
jgi:hypothetical protein